MSPSSSPAWVVNTSPGARTVDSSHPDGHHSAPQQRQRWEEGCEAIVDDSTVESWTGPAAHHFPDVRMMSGRAVGGQRST
ncbi:hypothetical protein CKAH01_03783 [Colletotrichum kahawae]|uniref:Uncharacterized protein n=1 Tax=Colletotrichum kahawae TaxID=34407 RepID=A0AAE0DB99_COLKA|nr:hypothetical protein CKAH01_03783 [Colletotrichum kahawae]